jgi:pyridinium-3,5-bisthiocarboxylic acid mononucleotide nickel chelatase
MKHDTIYFDLIGGASGNMLLGALLDAGLELDALRASLDGLALSGWAFETQHVTRRGIAATWLDVRVHDEKTERHLRDLLDVIAASHLPADVQATSARILTRLGEAEAQIHAHPIEQIHLHELGGLDTIVDVVGVVLGLRLLGVERVVVSPFPLARGRATMAHGNFPLPAPATLALLNNAPIVGVDGERETVTPTAAAILTTIANAYGHLPRMTPHAIGYGAGTRDDPTPNVLRVILGTSASTTAVMEVIVELETNIDDMNPQTYDYVMARLFEAGALDVTLTPMQMKKNRPATWLRVFAPVDRAAELRVIILNETTTLGVRERIVQRYTLAREIISVETEFGVVKAKVAHRPNGMWTVTPEYDDCVRVAREQRVPLQIILDTIKRRVQNGVAKPAEMDVPSDAFRTQ